MSHVYYDTLWQQANEELTDLIGIECPPIADPTQPVPMGPASLSPYDYRCALFSLLCRS
jgi:hypothetical protein